MKTKIILILLIIIIPIYCFAGTVQEKCIGVIGKKKGCTGWNCRFATDADLVALYQFEDSDNKGKDTKGSNDLTEKNDGSHSIALSETNMEGTYSASVTSGYKHGFYRTDANLSTDFPGKSGTGCVKTFSACYWVYSDMPSSGDYDLHVGKYKTASGDRSWRLWLFNDTIKKIGFTIAYADTGESVYHASDLSASTWYFICGSYDNADKSYAIRIRDSEGNTVGSDATGTMTLDENKMVCGDYEFWINNGSVDAGAYRINGYYDEVSIWKKVLTATEVTKIAQGTYGK